MIFVCTGTQIFQMNRLLKELDRLVENGGITEEVFAQTGHSDYVPKHYRHEAFLSPDDFQRYVDKADLVITHGGTGAIVKALKAGKQTIAVPRLYKYHEHENDHQLQIAGFFSEAGYLKEVLDMRELGPAIQQLRLHPIDVPPIHTGHVIEIVERFIRGQQISS